MDKPDKEKRIEEQIELVGVHLEKKQGTVEKLLEHNIKKSDIDNLRETGNINVSNSGEINFTPMGEKRFARLIRNHRLAERLMTDVLTISDKDAETVACEFEHFLNDDVADSICTFLGHPRTCPHGNSIPVGNCCNNKKKDVGPIIVSLNNLESGESGNVSYIATHNHSRLDKLTSMGIMPGKKVRMHQKKPAIVIMFDETTLSMDDEIASEIFVRYDRST